MHESVKVVAAEEKAPRGGSAGPLIRKPSERLSSRRVERLHSNPHQRILFQGRVKKLRLLADSHQYCCSVAIDRIHQEVGDASSLAPIDHDFCPTELSKKLSLGSLSQWSDATLTETYYADLAACHLRRW